MGREEQGVEEVEGRGTEQEDGMGTEEAERGDPEIVAYSNRGTHVWTQL